MRMLKIRPRKTNQDTQASSVPTQNRPGKRKDVVGQGILTTLQVTLQALQKLANSVPTPGVGGAVGLLLHIVGSIKQSAENEIGLENLRGRLESLGPILFHIAKDANAVPELYPLMTRIEQELNSLAMDIRDASNQGRIGRFFNSADNASSLTRHVECLDRIVADYTVIGVFMLPAKISMKTRRRSIKNIKYLTAGDGNEGGTSKNEGGEGGSGGAFRVAMRPGTEYNIEDLKGGMGGKGGYGRIVGGRGGAGGGFEFH